MAQVVLLQPKVGLWDSMRSTPSPPLGLLHAASLVEKEFTVAVVDQRISASWREDLKRALDSRTVCVGVTTFTGPMLRGAIEMSREARGLTRAPIVWGGVHPSMLPEVTLRAPYVDLIVEGEGEETLLDLARALQKGSDLKRVPGLWLKEGDRLLQTGHREFLDLDALPPPPYHLVAMERFMPKYQGRKSFFYQVSRGCPFPCAYCYNVAFNKRRWRAQSPAVAVERMRAILERYRNEDFFFVDDLFFVDLPKAREVVEALEDLKVTWQIQGIDLTALQRMDDEYLRLVERAGCVRFNMGVESGSERIRKLIRKWGSIDDVAAVARKLRPYNITLFLNFISSVPTETEEDIRVTVDFMFRLLQENPNVRISPYFNYMPYPGTELFDVAVRNGFVPPSSLEGWSTIEVENNNIFPEKKAFYDALFFASMFIDRKVEDYWESKLVRSAVALYRPFARLRMKHLATRLLVEKKLYEAARGFFLYPQAEQPA